MPVEAMQPCLQRQSSWPTEDHHLFGPRCHQQRSFVLANHPRLERLIATDRSAIGDAGIEALVSVPNLIELTLERSEITDAAYANLAKMKKLKNLRANLTKTTDVGVKQLADRCDSTGTARLSRLFRRQRRRHLGPQQADQDSQFETVGPQITDKSLAVIGTMTNMSTLGLQDTAVTGAGGAFELLDKVNRLGCISIDLQR